MGWWGYNIMEGDTPLDCQHAIIHYLADPELVTKHERIYYDLSGQDHRELSDQINDSAYDALMFPVNSTAALYAIRDGELDVYDEKNIAIQVLGEMIMCSGAPMTDELRTAFKLAAQQEIVTVELSEDGWDDPTGRVNALNAFIVRCNNYQDGHPIQPTSRGLFSVMGI